MAVITNEFLEDAIVQMVLDGVAKRQAGKFSFLFKPQNGRHWAMIWRNKMDMQMIDFDPKDPDGLLEQVRKRCEVMVMVGAEGAEDWEALCQ